MDIKNALEKEHSKTQAVKIASYLEKHPDQVKELMECFFSDQYRLCQRAAYPMMKLIDNAPTLLRPYLSKMVEVAHHPPHPALLRNTFRYLQKVDIPEELQGEVYELGFSHLISPESPIAIRVFAMTTLVNIAAQFPDLIDELTLAIQDMLPYGSAGIQSRGKKELMRLNKIKQSF